MKRAHLSSALKIRGLDLKNLLVLSPAEEYIDRDIHTVVAPLFLTEKNWSVSMTITEIETMKSNLADATELAVEAGFDAVELYAGYGSLFHHFYSEVLNQRTDRYGGCFKNRIRLLIETVSKIQSVIRENMLLIVRITADDYIEDDNSWKNRDSIELAKILKDMGADVVKV